MRSNSVCSSKKILLNIISKKHIQYAQFALSIISKYMYSIKNNLI